MDESREGMYDSQMRTPAESTMEPFDQFATLETSIVTAATDVYGTNWADNGATEHNDPFARLYYLRSGEACGWFGDVRLELRPGVITVIPAHTRARFTCSKPMHLSWLHLRATIFGGLCPFAVFGWEYQVPAEQTKRYSARWDHMIALVQRHDAAASLEADGIMRQMLAAFVGTRRSASRGNVREIGRFSPVFNYIEVNIAERIRLGDLARVSHLQPTYFSNLFTRLVGTTPMKYVARRKIAAAQAMLRRDDAPLKEIARDLGFADEFHFSKSFKKEVGMSPSEYRHRRALE
jgi:AraC-like DNA-binding protein/mannose-6-phosphate isomerase-like protein (cupin superfamily)